MKSVKLDATVKTEIGYPCLMQVNVEESGAGSVYIFWEVGSGVCIIGENGDDVGDYCANFDMRKFHSYTGTVQLSNN